jgi:hypothetical protein
MVKLRALLALIGGNAGANIVYLISLLLLGAVLNSVEFGHFRVAYAYLSIGISISLLGMNISITKRLPNLSVSQRRGVISFVVLTSLLASAVAGLVIYLYIPASDNTIFNFVEGLYFLSFPVAVAGGVLCNITLSVLQADNSLYAYSRFQLQWRAILFLSAVIGGLIFHSATYILIFMSFSYFAIFLLLRSYLYDFKLPAKKNSTLDLTAVPGTVRGALWPFASIAVSTFYSSSEFLYIKPSDISSGVAGSYSLASLIFIGGAAFFFPFQTYAGSQVVNGKIGLNGLLKLQIMCFILVAVLAGVSIFIAEILAFIDPQKFDRNFLDFSRLVAIKLGLWGMYAVTGSVLNFIGKEFESFLLSVVALTVLVLTPFLFDYSNELRDIVTLQIFTGVIILVGSTFLTIHAFKKNS